MRLQHLLALNATGAHYAWSGVKDEHDVWSEWSEKINFTSANFTAGSTEASVASGTTDELLLEEPSILFPDLNVGSGMISIRRTLVGQGFHDETRARKAMFTRAAFHCVLRDLDEYQVLLMHKFVRSLNGPFAAFLFDFRDRTTDQLRRYPVRFRDAQVVDQLRQVDRSDMDFTLVELVGISSGGDI